MAGKLATKFRGCAVLFFSLKIYRSRTALPIEAKEK